jgi:hypothetical protein
MKNTLLALLVCVSIYACKKTNEELVIPTTEDYAPLKIGKYITYSADSLIFINANTTEAHRFYEVKYTVSDSATDNLGRKGFRITRSIRNVGSGNFVPDNSFFAIHKNNTFELVENNLRFLKLAMPINNDYSWKGNSAINTSLDVQPYGKLLFFEDWDYTYSNVAEPSPEPIAGFNLTNTITVNQIKDSFNLPINDSTQIATKDFSREIFAKDLGLVYRKFLHWEYQISSKFTGFGLTLKMIDHN